MKKRRIKAVAKPGNGRIQVKSKSRSQPSNADLDNVSGSDVDSDSIYHDEIDDFHAGREKLLLGDDDRFKGNVSPGEEEVMPLTDDDDPDDEVEYNEEDNMDDDQQSLRKSDVESDEEISEDDLPNLEAWGKRKSMYYSTDFVDKDWGKSYREDDAEEAKAEEISALEIQRNFGATDLTTDVFDLDTFKVEKEVDNEKELETSVRDWNAVPKEDKLKLLKRDAPEFFLLANDFKEMMKQLNDRLSPIMEVVKDGRLQGCGAQYIALKHNIILHYCMNISFYMTLKSRGGVVRYHPVMKRVSAYKKLLNQMEPFDLKLNPVIDAILEKLKNGEDIEFFDKTSDVEDIEPIVSKPVDKSESTMLPSIKRLLEEHRSGQLPKIKKTKVTDRPETKTEKEVSSLYMDKGKKQKGVKMVSSSDDEEIQDEEYNDGEELENGDELMDEKRTITYQMSKNKGLLPYRKKEYRNPRVHNRIKYRRAKIRRKGQVREPRKELSRYGGELTGIRTDVTKSIKIK